MLFGEEPRRVIGVIDCDPEMKIDRRTSAILEFPSGECAFTCSTQLVPYQRIHLFGERGRIEVEIPFNAPPDRPTRLFVDDGSSLAGHGIRSEQVPTCDQYAIQADLFSRAILDNTMSPRRWRRGPEYGRD